MNIKKETNELLDEFWKEYKEGMSYERQAQFAVPFANACRDLIDALDKKEAELNTLTKGEQLPDGNYRPSKLEALQSDSEERDYWEEEAVSARTKLKMLLEATENITEFLPALSSSERLRQVIAIIKANT